MYWAYGASSNIFMYKLAFSVWCDHVPSLSQEHFCGTQLLGQGTLETQLNLIIFTILQNICCSTIESLQLAMKTSVCRS